ncbi:MAG: nuclear transport factor 2 family protein [Methyloversatilis sp.]|uniref:nuclear transport factor 2 family protein n=1 Tax=Methyloversatilis sp. TaxID=2569862 RepID=UPI002736B794|nr:nuclear transport factor 2 family protein [Methyloversatilis sp.]MDP3871923.1 nuclear transport factor 2 family protein [Methyloversatilis sp.]
MSADTDPRLRTLIAAFESLTPDTVDALAALYATDARFRDPFNDVRGRAAVARIFSHMFEQVGAPRFEVHSAMSESDAAWLDWTMHFTMRGQALQIVGATRLCFDDAGCVAEHRDYWDAAQELYEKLPVIGGAMRWLRRRLAVPGL